MNSDQLELEFRKFPWEGQAPRSLTKGFCSSRFALPAGAHGNRREEKTPGRVLQLDIFGHAFDEVIYYGF